MHEIYLFVLLRLLPESPRWLLVNKRYAQADSAIRRIARMNNKTLPPSFNVAEVDVEVNGKHAQTLNT